jgi:hypothetical protein
MEKRRFSAKSIPVLTLRLPEKQKIFYAENRPVQAIEIYAKKW